MVKIEVKTEMFEDTEPDKHRRVISSVEDVDRKFKRTLLCVAKPSYLLGILGRRTSRSEYLKKLPKILLELLRQRNWRDASSVLSVLMQGTMRDGSPAMNRLKYEAHIQIVSHLQPYKNKADEIGRIYDTWIGKIGKQHKEFSVIEYCSKASRLTILSLPGNLEQERLLVWFKQICHFIEHGMDREAYDATTSMMQSRDLGMLPRANLYIGITLFRLWCRKFQVELHPEDGDCSESISSMSESRSNSVTVKCSVRDKTFYSVESESEGSVVNESSSSVMNYKRTSHMSNCDSATVMDMKVKLEKIKLEESTQQFIDQPRFYATSEENEDSLKDGVAFDPALIEILGDMDPWLLPLSPPKDPDCYRKMVNDFYYKESVRYLRLTMQSPRHVSLAALHPLVQLLLIGGHVDEAMKVVEEMCNKVHDIKPLRIKAAMMEKFQRKSDMLAKCYEDILKIDPNCVTTLKKLIGMCIEDVYSRESLIEMIALHVEASFPEPEIWKEFASCLRLFFEDIDEDRMSICLDGSGEERIQQTYSVRYNPNPKMFTDTSWILRAKSWLNRHFSPEMLETDIKKLKAGTQNGDMEMMRLVSYKAACASHIYGPEFGYVTKVYGLLENHSNNIDFLKNDSNSLELYNFLRGQRQKWNRIYSLE
ncbi:unnamed protein product [Thlaspi arvense]|uniref:Uncharacterized protein n=1 Tax=Thlaspi arvense TaxID=13288 RepID=A0AAU9RAU4_THLAR|nr:unnamed protein product [Thlaspi arvense]